MKKIAYLLDCITPFLCAITLQILIFIIYSVVIGIQSATRGNDVETIDNIILTENALLISFFVVIVCICVFGLWYKKYCEKSQIATFKDINKPKQIGYIILLGFGLQLGLSGVIDLVCYIKPEWYNSYMEILMALEMGSNSLTSIIYIAIVAPIAEELIFRGVMLEKCKKNMHFIVANTIQALFFGFYHMNIVQGTYAFFIGLCLGLVCYKLKSVYAAILLHMAINIFGLLLSLVIPSDITIVNILYAIVSILSCGLIFIGCRYFYSFKVSDDNIYTFKENKNI